MKAIYSLTNEEEEKLLQAEETLYLDGSSQHIVYYSIVRELSKK